LRPVKKSKRFSLVFALKTAGFSVFSPRFFSQRVPDGKGKVYNRETGVPMPPTAPQEGCCHRHKKVVGSRQGFLSLLSLMSFGMLALNERNVA
jgi:hypothetical protein